ncbi:MAG TPA: DNA repair protein RecN [Steroidobacteraceae bacterium]|nr:DNA repair protein RecN [Steroidobacteraceae bacterium]
MLRHLQLRDFVIVDAAQLEFGAGLTALTGETGAGKSLIVDALSMIAGGRASAEVVRQGAERAEVAAIFAGLPPAAIAWLEARSIEHDGEVLVRRLIGIDGRSRAYLNGQMVPVQSLRELADLLLEIHGQQEFQRLVSREAQRCLLDEHGEAQALVAHLASIHQRHRECARELETRRTAAEDRDGRRELLHFQLGELRDELAAVSDVPALFVERKRIADRGRLAAGATTALAICYEREEASAHDLLAKAQAALRAAGGADPDLQAVGRLLDEAAINVREAADALRRYLEALDVDPARQDEIERRAAALESLARKHHVRPEELPGRAAEIERDLSRLDTAQVDVAQLHERLMALLEEYRAAAARLSTARRAAAADLGGRITTLMQSLGMPGGRFEVAVTTDPGEVGAHGQDGIDFLVGANPGQLPRALSKVASGGELSRIGLAVQVATAAKGAAACMVFDEVDAGVGGGTAEIVGRQLRALGERGQVLCVTHLPQVASLADAQLRVTKTTEGGGTRTRIEPLGAAERIEEIARMLGGIDVSDQARAHAREMLQRGAAPAVAGARPGRSRGAR